MAITTVRRSNPGWLAANGCTRGSREPVIPTRTHINAGLRRRGSLSRY